MWLTLDEAAEYAGWTVRTLQRYIKIGRLKAYSPAGGRSVRLRAVEIDALFEPVAL